MQYSKLGSLAMHMKGLQTDVLAFDVSHRFAVASLDHFFTDHSLHWWTSVALEFEDRDLNKIM